MSHSADTTTRRLQLATSEAVPIRLRLKRPWSQEPLYGLVLRLTSDWVAVQALVDGFHFDDVVILRRKDIASVTTHPRAELVGRAIEQDETRSRIFDAPHQSSSLMDLLIDIARSAELVMIHHHDDGHRWREVGIIRRVGSERLELHAIRDDGTWCEESGLRPLHGIRRIEAGGRYLTGLKHFGDPAPDYDPASSIAKIRL